MKTGSQVYLIPTTLVVAQKEKKNQHRKQRRAIPNLKNTHLDVCYGRSVFKRTSLYATNI